jgi:pyruvyltransferase
VTIRLYWQGGDTGKINFGDTIAPLILETITSRSVTFADPYNCDMIAIGSLLNKIVRRRWKRLLRLNFQPITVWGTGSLSSHALAQNFKLRPLAVRGPKTREAMGLPSSVPLGDPGLFVDRLAPRTTKFARWGIIPHIVDFDLPIIKALCERNRHTSLINLADPDVVGIVAQIAACDFVISSSLHGIIAADALGIPNIRMSLSENIAGADWKFADYLLSVGRSVSSPIVPSFNLWELEDTATCAGQSIVSGLCAGLEAAVMSSF